MSTPASPQPAPTAGAGAEGEEGEELETMGEVLQKRVRARVLESTRAIKRGDIVGALAELNAAVFLAPADPTLYERRADALLMIGDLNTAIANLGKTVQLTGGRNTGSKHVHRLALLHDMRGLSLLDDGEYDAAVVALNEAISLERRDEDTATFRLHRALAFIGQGNTVAAMSDLERLVDSAEDGTADAHFLLARLQLKSSRLERARLHLEAALGLEPEHAQALELARVMRSSTRVYEAEATRLMLLGAHRQAVTNLNAAIDLDPTSAALRKRRAIAHKAHGDAALAAQDLEQAIRLTGGTYPEAERLLTITYNDAGVVAAAEGRIERAAAFFEKAIKVDPTVPRFYVNRADLLVRRGKPMRALDDYTRAKALQDSGSARPDANLVREINDKVSIIHHSEGVACFNATDYEGALGAFSAAIECSPHVLQYRLVRGEVGALLGKWALVRGDAEAALRIRPNDERALRLLQRVAPSS